MWYKVFTDGTTGGELFAYSLDGEGEDEEQETKALLAYEKRIDEKNILVSLERRAGVPCETVLQYNSKDGTEKATSRANPLHGVYYRLQCGNAFAAGLYGASDFKGDEEAIDKATEYEGTLTKEEWRDGDRISCVLLYDPREH